MIYLSQLTLLLIATTTLLVLSIFTSNEAVISPQFGFAACFIPGIIYAFYYVDEWNLNLCRQTTEVIILGITVFVVVSALFGRLSRTVRIKLANSRHSKDLFPQYPSCCLSDSIPAWKMNLLLLLELVSLLLVVAFLIKNFGTNISDAIYAFRLSNRDVTSTNYVSLPGFVRLIRRIALATGYIVIYLFFNGIVYKSRRNRIAEIICMILAFANGVILGGRGDGLQLIASGFIIYLLVRRGLSGSISFCVSDIIKIIVIVTIVLVTFAGLGSLLGRQMDFLDFNDYIAVYLSAELKNLDIFIRKGSFGTSFKNSQTMMNVVNTFGSLLGQQNWIHSLDNPYHYIGKNALGNVSTIFYAFMYDGGYAGVIGYTALFAAISQIIFQHSLRAKTRYKISLSILFYSYVWYTVIFSFFSDKFYEMIFNTAFIWTMLSWTLIIIFLNTKIKIKMR